MAIAIQLNPEKNTTGCSVPTIVPALEFEPGKSYEFDDETARRLLDLPDGPFVRSSLKQARQQQAQGTDEEHEQPATTEAAPVESEAR